MPEAMRVEPERPDLQFAHAEALAALGRSAEAAAGYRAALRLRSPWPEVENNLAWLLATDDDPAVRAPAEAVSLAERAAAGILDTLAKAYAAAGRPADAAAAAREAEAAARAAADASGAPAATLAPTTRREP